MARLILLFFPVLVFCANLDEIKLELIKEYKNNFPDLNIQNLELYANTLPSDFKDYRFLKLGSAKFNRANGYVRAEFKTKENIQRNLFFRYFIKANLEVLKSTKEIKRGQKLGLLDFSVSLVDFDKLPSDILLKDENLDLVAKSTIKKNTILRASMFKSNHLIKKNERVNALLKDENIGISVELIAIQSGNLGQKIKLKNDDGKIFQGSVIGEGRVILE
ncbi:flagellar basal body P-ring formation chaperone FlgA [Campylobacter sp. MIT 99-7217]|uniref:flagellar basal body P-ring formation chaperone FlgA n=1 Tax=Campylobacter sp. MIT 99-7217 TaxID=535091 RepID=UPI0021AFB9FA|nr:flagellar basal body P-ring formation chaperone FlgA [Campylobacter sp. MIT 99-7217]